MINLRYHIVSITAVFLALGIGIALGSTFLDGATVDVLNRNIRSAEARIKDTNAENERLSKELTDATDRDTALIVIGSEDLLADHLTDVPVLMVAAPGVDRNRLDAMSTVLARTGADLRGTLELHDELAFTGDPDGDLADAAGLTDPTSDELRAAVDEQLVAALIAAGAPAPETPDTPAVPETTTTTTAPGATTTTTVPGSTSTTTPTTTTTAPPVDPEAPDGTQPEIITALADGGYLAIKPGPGYSGDDPILETTGYRFVYVSAPGLDAAQNDVLVRLLPTGSADTLPAVVITATVPPADEDAVVIPTAVERVRGTKELADRYSTIDNADTFAGMVATVFSLQEITTGQVGHFGQADGATAVLPPVP